VKKLFKFWSSVVEVLSSEWLLTRTDFPNGGGIIALRSLLTSAYIYLGVIVAEHLIDPDRSWVPSWIEFRIHVVNTLPWFGAIFAGVYAAFYTRFASQWTYLSGVYNQIKAAECSCGVKSDALAEWKAGFLEDSEVLHLSTKELFASIVHAWAREENVRRAFELYTQGGLERLDALLKKVESTHPRLVNVTPAESATSQHGTAGDATQRDRTDE